MPTTYDEYGNEIEVPVDPDAPYGRSPGGYKLREDGTIDTGATPPSGSEPPATSTGGGGGTIAGGMDADQLYDFLRAGGYPGSKDPAEMAAAYANSRPGASGGGTGNTGGGQTPGILTGYDNFLMQQAMLNSQAAIQLGQAQLEEQRQRRINVDMPTMENNRRYQEAQIRLKEAEETFRRELDRIKFEFEQKKYDRTQGEIERQFDTTTAMDIWKQQGQQAQDRAALTGAYAAPAATPTLPGYSIRQMFDKDVKSYLGREPTLQEYQQWLMWGQNSREPRPQRPQDRLGPLSGMPQPTAGNAAPYPSPAPGVPGGSTLQEVRAAAERDIGRAMSEPEWRTYLSGRFDPEHPHVKSGQAQAGQVLGPEYSRPWDVHRSKLPTAWQETYRANTGQEPGQYEAPKPTAAAAPSAPAPTVAPVGTPDPTAGIPDVMDEETRRRLRQAALAAA